MTNDAVPVTAEDLAAEAAFDRHIVETIGWTKFASMQTVASGAEYSRAFKAGWLARHRGSTAGVEPCGVCGHGLTTQIGASLQAKADGAAEWMRRAAAAEIGVIQAREALQKIATESLASLSQTPATPMVQEGLREAAIKLAYAAGALNAATDGQETVRPERLAVLDSLKEIERALSATPAQEGAQ